MGKCACAVEGFILGEDGECVKPKPVGKACEGQSDCGENGICNDDDRCECNDGFEFNDDKECVEKAEHEHDCPENVDFDDMDVTCSPSGLEVTVPVCAFVNAGVNHEDVHLAGKGEDCGPTEDEGIVSFSIPASETCGTEISKDENGDKMTYKNVINGVAGSKHGSVSRQRALTVEFSCSLNLDKVISMTQGISPMISTIEVKTENKESTFEVKMVLYEDGTEDAAPAPEDFTVNVPDKLFIGLALSVDTMVLEATKCWATPSDDPEDDTSYEFMGDACGGDEYLDIIKNGESDAVKFSLDSFQFGDDTESKIFIHCNVHICDPKVDECGTDCTKPASRRRRRYVESDSIKVGPINVINI